MEKSDIQNTPKRDRFLSTNQVTIDKLANSTAISKYSKKGTRASGISVGGWVWPDSNSGFGNRCCANAAENCSPVKIKNSMTIICFFILIVLRLNFFAFSTNALKKVGIVCRYPCKRIRGANPCNGTFIAIHAQMMINLNLHGAVSE